MSTPFLSIFIFNYYTIIINKIINSLTKKCFVIIPPGCSKSRLAMLSGDLHESLGKFPNPAGPNNWNILAGKFCFNPCEIGNIGLTIDGGHAEFTQKLLAS